MLLLRDATNCFVKEDLKNEECSFRKKKKNSRLGMEIETRETIRMSHLSVNPHFTCRCGSKVTDDVVQICFSFCYCVYIHNIFGCSRTY